MLVNKHASIPLLARAWLEAADLPRSRASLVQSNLELDNSMPRRHWLSKVPARMSLLRGYIETHESIESVLVCLVFVLLLVSLQRLLCSLCLLSRSFDRTERGILLTALFILAEHPALRNRILKDGAS